MAYDKKLAQRVVQQLSHRRDVVTKQMFGGLAFMVAGHMTCGIVKDKLMLRVMPDKYATYLTEPYTQEMDFTGRPLKGMLYIDQTGIEDEQDLVRWLERGLAFIDSMPPK